MYFWSDSKGWRRSKVGTAANVWTAAASAVCWINRFGVI